MFYRKYEIYLTIYIKPNYVCLTFLLYCASEWVEFTPYEIGMDKYGTFMKTELFGSKFFCGKLVEKFPEFPLYYLQGLL